MLQLKRPLHIALHVTLQTVTSGVTPPLHAALQMNLDWKKQTVIKKVRVFLRPNFLHEAAYNVGLQRMAL